MHEIFRIILGFALRHIREKLSPSCWNNIIFRKYIHTYKLVYLFCHLIFKFGICSANKFMCFPRKNFLDPKLQILFLLCLKFIWWYTFLQGNKNFNAVLKCIIRGLRHLYLSSNLFCECVSRFLNKKFVQAEVKLFCKTCSVSKAWFRIMSV